MAEWWWLTALLVIIGAVTLLFVWSPVQSALRNNHFAQARRDFHLQRERLEVKFIQRAATRAKPNARWSDCEFDNDVAYVRNRATGELAAFVAITVALEDLDVPSSGIGHFRAGTAVFRFDRHHWETDGIALLNLTPSEAVRFYKGNLEIVAQELAG
jgi:hypothetical protein